MISRKTNTPVLDQREAKKLLQTTGLEIPMMERNDTIVATFTQAPADTAPEPAEDWVTAFFDTYRPGTLATERVEKQESPNMFRRDPAQPVSQPVAKPPAPRVPPGFTAHKCRCGTTFTVNDATGIATPHTRPGGSSYCMGYIDVTQAAVRAFEEEQEARDRLLPPAVPPVWFKVWGEEALPTIALPAKGRMIVWLPERRTERQNLFLGEILGSRVQYEWEGSVRCWTVPNRYFLVLSAAMLKEYPRISIGREYDPNENCTGSCKQASGYICTCSCKGKHHGHGSWMRDWDVKNDRTAGSGGADWYWMAVEKKEQLS
ncbi:hypothetical protein ACIQ9M_34365 [Streptomyces californicus]|uniref:hypothetical protein n=1 Tax=Streptomyces californicus TaxID=67351 RepID=UPI0036BCC106